MKYVANNIVTEAQPMEWQPLDVALNNSMLSQRYIHHPAAETAHYLNIDELTKCNLSGSLL